MGEAKMLPSDWDQQIEYLAGGIYLLTLDGRDVARMYDNERDAALYRQMTAQTAAQRKAAERQRRVDQGLARLEVYAHPDDHQAIKDLAARLQRKRVRNRLRATEGI